MIVTRRELLASFAELQLMSRGKKLIMIISVSVQIDLSERNRPHQGESAYISASEATRGQRHSTHLAFSAEQ
jgi:hypothetical protein